MKIQKRGIEISNLDGSALSSGNLFYWDAQLANIFLCETSKHCPDVRFEQNKNDTKEFNTLFFKNSENGTELCSKSKDISDCRVKIPEEDLDDFISKLDIIHQKSEKDGIPSDNAFFMHNLAVPNPLQMKSAWRVTTDFNRRLLVLWGYVTSSTESVVLPLTPTSAKWDDAGRRVDLKKRISDMGLLTKRKFNWRKFFRLLLNVLLFAALILLIIAFIFAIQKGNSVNSVFDEEPKTYNGDKEINGNDKIDDDNVGDDDNQNNVTDKGLLENGVPKPEPQEVADPSQIEGNDKIEDGNVGDDDNQDNVTDKGPSENGVPKPEPQEVADPSQTIEQPGPISKKPESQENKDVQDKDSITKKEPSKDETPELMSCPECGVEIKDGECPNLCAECKSHLNENKKCPNVCPECAEHFGNGKCRNTCDECDAHKKDGVCPNTCAKGHELLHKKNGLCPKCDKLIERVDFVVRLTGERKEGNDYYLSFALEASHNLSDNSSVTWYVNNEVGGLGRTFVPRNGFKADGEYKVQAKISYSEKGVLKKGISNVYVWKKNVDPSVVERHIGIVGGSRSDKDGRYYVLKVFSNPEEKVSGINWTVTLNEKRIDTETEKKILNATRIYISEISDEGKIKVKAVVKCYDGVKRNVEGTFVYKTDILTTSNSFDDRNSERGVKLKELVTPSIFLCLAGKSTGTAFAITQKDLITNYHVIEESMKNGNVLIYNNSLGSPIEAQIVSFNKENDLAWLKVKNNLNVPSLPVDRLGCKEKAAVAAFGFPYSSFSTTDYKQPVVNVTFGEILSVDSSSGDVVHSANIYQGNSGGPLISMDGKVVGVNTLVAYKNNNGNMENQKSVARSADKIYESFPNLRLLERSIDW